MENLPFWVSSKTSCTSTKSAGLLPSTVAMDVGTSRNPVHMFGNLPRRMNLQETSKTRNTWFKTASQPCKVTHCQPHISYGWLSAIHCMVCCGLSVLPIFSHTVTVDGRNPAPVDRLFIPLFTRFYTSQVVQDFRTINNMAPQKNTTLAQLATS